MAEVDLGVKNPKSVEGRIGWIQLRNHGYLIRLHLMDWGNLMKVPRKQGYFIQNL
jgi:hypothetical protein